MAPGGAEIKGLTQFKEVIAGDKPVIIDFSASWCGPCKVISPIFNQLAADEKYKDNALFVTLDVDEEEDIAQEVGIKAMPTFMVFKNGEKVDTFVGADKNKLPEFIAKYASA
ncbi:thioredoxin [Cystobasidium minutum MCA 4210]|uniref:thioredoxin n=1 Tax=Cystobasidium minutum MCA 4210 TaxID=1397322 RepID=UPI0034CD4E1B|eukprot:jgi/Rhomi1/17332/CE17331_6476